MAGNSELLTAGKAFADLSGWRKIGVSGADALDWLNDLLSADIADLSQGRARRSLLLTPTGRIRADVTVTVPGGELLLIQEPSQPSIGDLLSPYVLSSDVELDDRTENLCLFALPGRTSPPDAAGTALSAPSCLGAGVDLIAMAEDHDRILLALSKGNVPASHDDLDAWRIAAGIPRFGVDVLDEDLPQEAGLEGAVAFDKGCYLGQEAVAKVRNLGHPRRVLIHLRGDERLAAGEAVHVNGGEAGVLSSAAPAGHGSVALARIRWDAREGPFRTAAGTELTPVG